MWTPVMALRNFACAPSLARYCRRLSEAAAEGPCEAGG